MSMQNNVREFGAHHDQLGNLALSLATTSDDAIPELEKALRISGVLQTTLDLTRIIEIFAHEGGKVIPFDHILYRHPERSLEIGFGTAAPHSSTYRLVVAGEPLGEITFSRRRKFLKAETHILETLLCGLVYPLRNALLYHLAIEAAQRDPLTGVNNRAALHTTMAREIGLAHRHGSPLSLLAMDIDHFKRVNDTYGHAVGDCVIKAVAAAAQAGIRSSDIVFRYGGEEFLILLSNTSSEGAMLLAERLRRRIAETDIICDGRHISTTVSVGIGCLQPADTADTLFARADRALYDAKAAGRNCCRLRVEVPQPEPAFS